MSKNSNKDNVAAEILKEQTETKSVESLNEQAEQIPEENKQEQTEAKPDEAPKEQTEAKPVEKQNEQKTDSAKSQAAEKRLTLMRYLQSNKQKQGVDALLRLHHGDEAHTATEWNNIVAEIIKTQC